MALSPLALEARQAQKALTFPTGGGIWHDPRKNESWASDAHIRKSLWQPLCKRAGVRYRNSYQMRHTYASNWLTADADHWHIVDQLERTNLELSIYDTSNPKSCQRAGAFAPLSHADQTADKTGHVKRLIFGTHSARCRRADGITTPQASAKFSSTTSTETKNPQGYTPLSFFCLCSAGIFRHPRITAG